VRHAELATQGHQPVDRGVTQAVSDQHVFPHGPEVPAYGIPQAVPAPAYQLVAIGQMAARVHGKRIYLPLAIRHQTPADCLLPRKGMLRAIAKRRSC